MKTKVGELYNKPIVIGNSNEFNKNEIPLNKLGGGSAFDNGMEYYKIDDSSILWGLNNHMVINCIIPDSNGKNHLVTGYDGALIALCTSGKVFTDSDFDTTMKDSLIERLDIGGIVFDKEPTIHKITEKEYYSLLD